jgi:hypothetical protein
MRTRDRGTGILPRTANTGSGGSSSGRKNRRRASDLLDSNSEIVKRRSEVLRNGSTFRCSGFHSELQFPQLCFIILPITFQFRR